MKKILILALLLFLPANVYAKEWYEGGNLHKKTALDWQVASYDNKLATCADFISSLWQKKSFKPELQRKITSLDEIKTLSQELVKSMDKAFAKDPDPEKNKRMFVNQNVSSTAVLLMVMMGWL